MTTKVETSIFHVEAPLSTKPEKIFSYFKKSILIKYNLDGLLLREFNLKTKQNDSNLFEAVYELNLENLSSLDSLKHESSTHVETFKIITLDNLSMYGKILEEIVKQENNTKNLVYPNYKDFCRFNFMKELGGDGMELINQEILEKFGQVIKTMLSTLGKNFLGGSKNLFRVPVPIYINDQRSLMET